MEILSIFRRLLSSIFGIMSRIIDLFVLTLNTKKIIGVPSVFKKVFLKWRLNLVE